MHKQWPEMARELNALVATLRQAQPEVMKGFSQMSQAALRAGALDVKTKELMALAISIAIRCDACITFHAKSAIRAGATEAELNETMGLAVYMGAGPSAMYAAQALEAVSQWRSDEA